MAASAYGPRVAFGLAVLALGLLAVGPLGWRLGLWHYTLPLRYLLPDAGCAGAAAAVAALASGSLWNRLEPAGRAMALAALLLGVMATYVPWAWRQAARVVPAIADVTTDTQTPPRFLAVLPARQAERSNPVEYDSKAAERQRAGYPDIQPLIVALPPAEAFTRALDTVQHMKRWTIAASDPAAGRIEASYTSFWYGFVDDIVIRIASEAGGSRIDLRSKSRHGNNDRGENARHIRSYFAALKPRLG